MHLLSNYDEHVVAYRDHGHTMDPEARETLHTRGNGALAVHLIARNGLVQVEKKEDLRARIGRSPDDADALLLCYFDPPREFWGAA